VVTPQITPFAALEGRAAPAKTRTCCFCANPYRARRGGCCHRFDQVRSARAQSGVGTVGEVEVESGSPFGSGTGFSGGWVVSAPHPAMAPKRSRTRKRDHTVRIASPMEGRRARSSLLQHVRRPPAERSEPPRAFVPESGLPPILRTLRRGAVRPALRRSGSPSRPAGRLDHGLGLPLTPSSTAESAMNAS
jgi:hypothetical protein